MLDKLITYSVVVQYFASGLACSMNQPHHYNYSYRYWFTQQESLIPTHYVHVCIGYTYIDKKKFFNNRWLRINDCKQNMPHPPTNNLNTNESYLQTYPIHSRTWCVIYQFEHYQVYIENVHVCLFCYTFVHVLFSYNLILFCHLIDTSRYTKVLSPLLCMLLCHLIDTSRYTKVLSPLLCMLLCHLKHYQCRHCDIGLLQFILRRNYTIICYMHMIF